VVTRLAVSPMRRWCPRPVRPAARSTDFGHTQLHSPSSGPLRARHCQRPVTTPREGRRRLGECNSPLRIPTHGIPHPSGGLRISHRFAVGQKPGAPRRSQSTTVGQMVDQTILQHSVRVQRPSFSGAGLCQRRSSRQRGSDARFHRDARRRRGGRLVRIVPVSTRAASGPRAGARPAPARNGSRLAGQR